MVRNAEEQKHLVLNQAQGQFFKNENDPRVTRLGKFLRRTSLDEFPQFWNVLVGDMSLVGTRPPTPDEVQCYETHHHQRLLVKPGLTGEWQVKGRSLVTNFEEVVQLDLAYQRKWSIGYDIQLILKTFFTILGCKGAY
jgi:lipopolysaccharide/colanic/teichoic acid biosynthesis glycosyltransferase